MAGYYQITSESFSVSRDDSSATETRIIPWADAAAYAQTVTGGYITLNGIRVFRIPAQHHTLLLFCNDCRVEPFNYDADGQDWLDAKATLTYGILDQPQGDDDTQVGDVSIEVQGEEMVLPKANFTVDGDELGDDDINPVKVIPVISLKITYHSQPTISPTAWINYVGKVNSSSFEGYPAETVMFQNPSASRTITTDGNDSYDYTYTFVVRPQGWNKIYRPGDGWVELDPPMYETANLYDILP